MDEVNDKVTDIEETYFGKHDTKTPEVLRNPEHVKT